MRTLNKGNYAKVKKARGTPPGYPPRKRVPRVNGNQNFAFASLFFPANKTLCNLSLIT
jgi:hypothetical protein